MNTKDTGGPAFPTYESNRDGHIYGTSSGLDMRDYFAAKVLQGLWALPSSFENDEMTFEMCAETAYKQADAMLAERNKP